MFTRTHFNRAQQPQQQKGGWSDFWSRLLGTNEEENNSGFVISAPDINSFKKLTPDSAEVQQMMISAGQSPSTFPPLPPLPTQQQSQQPQQQDSTQQQQPPRPTQPAPPLSKSAGPPSRIGSGDIVIGRPDPTSPGLRRGSTEDNQQQSPQSNNNKHVGASDEFTNTSSSSSSGSVSTRTKDSSDNIEVVQEEEMAGGAGIMRPICMEADFCTSKDPDHFLKYSHSHVLQEGSLAKLNEKRNILYVFINISI